MGNTSGPWLYEHMRDATEPFRAILTLFSVAKIAASRKLPIFARPFSVVRVEMSSQKRTFSIPSTSEAWRDMVAKMAAEHETLRLKKDFAEQLHATYSKLHGEGNCHVEDEVFLLQWMFTRQDEFNGKCCVGMSKQPSVPSIIYYLALGEELDPDEDNGKWVSPPQFVWNPFQIRPLQEETIPFPWSLSAECTEELKNSVVHKLFDVLMQTLKKSKVHIVL
ncbi:unnamed protein product [Cyclocybe aegerita]|uniref:Uncharacterized protein n=1 Tax=Cyclocybe aegerita TaxID=1973307 RepID=A0A8S0VSQ3_CYCAE|nr:unnamed protein product [Cyclocybe aegerita]